MAARHQLLRLENPAWGRADIRAVRKAGARLPNKEQAVRQSGWPNGFIRRQWGKLAEMLNTASCGQIHSQRLN